MTASCIRVRACCRIAEDPQGEGEGPQAADLRIRAVVDGLLALRVGLVVPQTLVQMGAGRDEIPAPEADVPQGMVRLDEIPGSCRSSAKRSRCTPTSQAVCELSPHQVKGLQA